MKSLVLSTLLVLFGLNSMAAVAPQVSKCEERAKETARQHLVENYGEGYVSRLWGPLFVAAHPKGQKELVIIDFQTGGHDIYDITYYSVSVLFSETSCAVEQVYHEVWDAYSADRSN